MCDIDIEEDAISNVKKYLIENYKECEVAFITTKNLFYKNKQYLTNLKNLPLNLKVYFVEKFAKCDNLFLTKLEKIIVNVKFVFVMGSGNIIDLVKLFCFKNNLEYSIILTGVNYSNCMSNYAYYFNPDELLIKYETGLPRCIYADINMINNTNCEIIANSFAYLLSMNILLCEMLYLDYDYKIIDDVNLKLKEINIFTSYNIMTKKGKVNLLKQLLELELLLNKLNLNNTLLKLVNLYNKYYNKDMELLSGEISLIFSLLILSMYECLIDNKTNFKPINIEGRIERLKTLFHKDKYVSNAISDLENSKYEDLKDIKDKKPIFKKYIKLALNRITNNFNMLKRMYTNKGVKFNYIKMQNFYNTLSLSGDIIDDKYIKTLRNLGMIDLI